MNVLIVGDGREEAAWADWFASRRDFRLAAAYPGVPGEDFDDLVVAEDLDEALAVPGLDLAVVGGPLEVRGEAFAGRPPRAWRSSASIRPGPIPRPIIRSH